MRDRSWWMIVAVAALAVDAVATEYPLRPTPESVGTIVVEGREMIAVDCGRISESVRRDPRECDAQRARLRAFQADARTEQWFQERALDTGKAALWAGARELERIDEYVRTHGHATTLRRAETARDAVLPVSDAVGTTPYEGRQALRLIFYDDRDPEQRAWLLRYLASERPDRLETVVASGWKTPGALGAFAQEQGVAISPFPSDDYPRQFGVAHLPAIVTFPDAEHVRVREGLEGVEERSAAPRE